MDVLYELVRYKQSGRARLKMVRAAFLLVTFLWLFKEK
jgi:hypothetical protein